MTGLLTRSAAAFGSTKQGLLTPKPPARPTGSCVGSALLILPTESTSERVLRSKRPVNEVWRAAR